MDAEAGQNMSGQRLAGVSRVPLLVRLVLGCAFIPYVCISV